MKKRIYIASPYTNGDNLENIRIQLDTFKLLIDKGYTPFAPLWSGFQHLVHPMSWEQWMEWDLQWLICCDGLLRLPGKSKGADLEVKKANEAGIPVYYSIDEIPKPNKSTEEMLQTYDEKSEEQNRLLKLTFRLVSKFKKLV
jgi:hypothetical protein